MSKVEQNLFSALGRSASVLLSNQINMHLLKYFNTSEILLTVSCMHFLVDTFPDKTSATWHTLSELMHSIVIQSLANYISTGFDPITNLINVLIVMQFMDCIPAVTGWVGKDLQSFNINVTYIFADLLSSQMSENGIPFFGGVLGICLRGQGLFGKTMGYTGMTMLCKFLFSVQGMGELTLSWPVFILYFMSHLSNTFKLDDYYEFGLFKASDAVFSGLASYGVSAQVISMGFIFLLQAQPEDSVWTGICSLVLVNTASSYILDQVNFISNTDPILSALIIVTIVHFAVIVLIK